MNSPILISLFLVFAYKVNSQTFPTLSIDYSSLKSIHVKNSSQKFDLPCTYSYENLVTVGGSISIKDSSSSTVYLIIPVTEDCQRNGYSGTCNMKVSTNFDKIWRSKKELKGMNHLVYGCSAGGDDHRGQIASQSICCGYLNNSSTTLNVSFCFVMLSILTVLKQFFNHLF